jgi:hypothetical protein
MISDHKVKYRQNGGESNRKIKKIKYILGGQGTNEALRSKLRALFGLLLGEGEK